MNISALSFTNNLSSAKQSKNFIAFESKNKTFTDVPKKAPEATAKIANNLEAVQAQYKIMPAKITSLTSTPIAFGNSKKDVSNQEEINATLDEFVAHKIITKNDYNHMKNGKSEINHLMKNHPDSDFCNSLPDFLDNFYQKFLEEKPILTTLEGDSFLFYESRGGCKELNKALRENEYLHNDELKTVKTGLNKALDKLPNYTGTVYRSLDNFDEVYHLKVGDIYNPKEFLSTSTEKSMAESFYISGFHPARCHFIIQSKNGKNLADAAPSPYSLDGRNSTDEVLFKSDSKFKTLAIETDTSGKTYYMEEI